VCVRERVCVYSCVSVFMCECVCVCEREREREREEMNIKMYHHNQPLFLTRGVTGRAKKNCKILFKFSLS